MFQGCKKLKNIDLTSLKTDKIDSIRKIFCNCEKFESIKFPHFINYVDVSLMCNGCENLKYLYYDLRNKNIASEIENEKGGNAISNEVQLKPINSK